MSTLIMNPPLHVPSYRLTRRGRLVVFLLGFAVVVALGIAFSGGSVATSEKGTPPPSKIVVVAPGVTLWDIASDASTGGDVRDMMQRIEDLNSLDTSVLAAGQRVRVPTS